MPWFRFSRGFPQKLSKTSFNFACNCNVRNRSRRDCDLCLFSQACRDASLRKSKIWRLSLLHYPPPPPTSDVNALPRPQIVRVPTGLCIKTRLSSQPLIWKWFFIFIQIKLIFTRKAVHLASSFLTGERLRILYEVLHEVHIIKSRFVKMTK